METDSGIIALSGQLLLCVKIGNATNELEQMLSALPLIKLTSKLGTDDEKKTFWINIYNAFFQLLTTKDKKNKPGIFSEKLITIAGNKISLDDIEHGILRRYRWKYSLGYFSQPFPSKLFKQLAVSKIDFRIHFALNCGAVSCPPIAFYKLDTVNQQLDMATTSFLASETIINTETKKVTVTRLMKWFKADFGGKKGIKTILNQYLKKDFSNFTICYSDYSWDEQLNNFSE